MSLITPETRIKVSSVANRDNKEYGRQNLIDRSQETCWNSEPGLPQWILLDFGRDVKPTKLNITFQGGFVGSTAIISASNTADLTNLQTAHPVYFDDINLPQTFDIKTPESLGDIRRLKIEFTEGSDFYGRITIYDLDIL